MELKKLNEELDDERKKSADFQVWSFGNDFFMQLTLFLFKDKYMRALAENQNTLNRMRKQVDDAKVYGVQNLVKDLLEVWIVLPHHKLHNSSRFW